MLLVLGATLAQPDDNVTSDDDDITDEEFESYPGCDGRVRSILVDEEESLQSPETNTGDVTCRWKLTAKQDSVSKVGLLLLLLSTAGYN